LDALLLVRSGLVFIPSAEKLQESRLAQAAVLNLTDLGFIASTRLESALAVMPAAELVALQSWMHRVLAESLGADRQHHPLFSRFPEDVPADTGSLWWKRVLIHFLQADGQPCLCCGRRGTTHVLNPCRHVVCSFCFDGGNYAGCPICGVRADQTSPFFVPTAEPSRAPGEEQVRFRLLEIGDDRDEQACRLFVAFCDRKQPMSPTDVEAFKTIIQHYGERILVWLPEKVPVKENRAHIFGALLQLCRTEAVLAAAKPHLATATDVLRVIAAYSGVDPSLQTQTVFKRVEVVDDRRRWWGQIARLLGAVEPASRTYGRVVPQQIKRFKVARLRRPLRRALLGLLESFQEDLLTEDMLRHQSYWVWVGEFLHPHEYADRYPKVARAFAVIRKKDSRGTPAPDFQTYYGRLDAAVRAHDSAMMLDLLRARPGEFGRRFDHTVRVAGQDDVAVARVVDQLLTVIPSLPTPMLLTLRTVLPKRVARSPVRVFWPKGGTANAPALKDERATLPRNAVEPTTHAIERELLRRFGQRRRFPAAFVDTDLQSVMVPFNERTASPAAVSLPRGSSVPIPEGKTLRLFLHWCQPAGGARCDLDLSVGFYDAAWQYRGVCSYYELTLQGREGDIAKSSGDYTSAPFPDGASEFIDLRRDRALAEGYRYAVMVLNNYSGLPFELLERAFAGISYRDDVTGTVFDPRTVELKFSLKGSNGVFMPVVIDLVENRLHWIDAYSKGGYEFNNVASSNRDIRTVCPNLLQYFRSGERASMFDLSLLHAASRTDRVFLRGATTTVLTRRSGESDAAFLERLRGGEDAVPAHFAAGDAPIFAALMHGDITLPEGSDCYALFRERVVAPLTASDLLT
jgi:hypothetical protein